MGLQLRFPDVVAPLKNGRFVVRTVIAGFVFSPILAWLITKAVPMERPYATALLLLSFAPAAPFLPLVVSRARGDLAAAAGLMVLASVGAVVVMPFGVPLLAPGMSADPWNVARPLLFLILLPLVAGMLLKKHWSAAAYWLHRFVKPVTAVGTILFLVLSVVLNFSGFIASLESRALLAQVLFVSGLTVGGYVVAAGIPTKQRSVISLGMCTRNIGVAAAVVGTDGDPKIMVMLVIAALTTVGISFAAAAWFGRSARENWADATSPETLVARAGSKN